MKTLERLLRARDNKALALLAVFTAFSVFGYWNFALHPERLPEAGWTLTFFSVSFQFFAQLHIVIAAPVLGLLLFSRLGWRWWPAAVAVYCVSLFSELVGTGYGVPFGHYQYTSLLGFRLGGRVPALIPLSWFLMALPSWVIARAALGKGAGVTRIALGALLLLVWDLALDPAMSRLIPYSRGEDAGPYYGMPLLNIVGWLATGLVIMGALDFLAERSGLARLPVRWMICYYAVILSLPLGMVLAGGLWGAVLVTLSGVVIAALLPLVVRRAHLMEEPTYSVEPSPLGMRS